MRDVIFAVVMAVGVLLMCLWTADMLLSLQPPDVGEPLRNAYWPFSVELQVRDL